jgi:hypothetical protein
VRRLEEAVTDAVNADAERLADFYSAGSKEEPPAPTVDTLRQELAERTRARDALAVAAERVAQGVSSSSGATATGSSNGPGTRGEAAAA